MATSAYLALAIVFEVAWAVAMKLSQGFTRPGPAAVTVVAYLLSVVFLALATRRLDLSVAYATWGGAGMALIAVCGVLYFREPLTLLKAGSLALILIGIVGLHWSSPGHDEPAHAAGQPAISPAASSPVPGDDPPGPGGADRPTAGRR
jgi:small multidrug resistance pump